MSGSDRNERFAYIALGILTFSIWTYAIWQISGQQAYQANYAKHDAYAASEAADKALQEVCLVAPTIEETIRCIDSIVNPEREYRQASKDLQAQQSMANSAIWMAVLAIGQTVIAGLGTFLLIRTFQQGQQANELVLRDQRPWLTLNRIIECDVSRLFLDPSNPIARNYGMQVRLSWRYKIENRGKSPAFGFAIKQKIVAVKSIVEADLRLQEFCNGMDFAAETTAEHTIFPGDIDEFPRSASVMSMIQGSESDEIFLLVVLAYRSYDNKVLGIEARALSVESPSHRVGPHNARLIEYAHARITK